MYSKRRPVKAVYGKNRAIKQSDLLWDEAITASPIARRKAVVLEETTQHKCLTTTDTPVLTTKRTGNDVALSKDRPVLKTANPNIMSAKLPTTKVSKPQPFEVSLVNSEQGSDRSAGTSMLEPPVSPPLVAMPSPITASTPLQRSNPNPWQTDVTRSHIRFDSSLIDAETASPVKYNDASSPSPSSDMSSDLSEIESGSDLAELTGAFEGLRTAPDETDDLEKSVAEEGKLQDIQTLLQLCRQTEPVDFHTYISDVLESSIMNKLGEASFSEVFVGTSLIGDEQTVYKVIPFGEQADEVPIHDITQELRISSTMSSVKGYVKLKDMKVVQGIYPESLLVSWDAWHTERESENSRPDWYKPEQRYCIISLENGGVDLEHYNIKTWSQALVLLTDIIETLALGELECEFEHRDLHWGNVLVKDSGAESRITIIDYTLSRALVRDHLSDIAYYGFTDRAIFEAEGEDYQFDIYRLMRDSITDGSQSLEAEDWIKFHPTTNALWIHYLVDKLLYAKDLKKPALRVSKRNSELDADEIQAWKTLESICKLLNPQRKYKAAELAIDSASRIRQLLDEGL